MTTVLLNHMIIAFLRMSGSPNAMVENVGTLNSCAFTVSGSECWAHLEYISSVLTERWAVTQLFCVHRKPQIKKTLWCVVMVWYVKLEIEVVMRKAATVAPFDVLLEKPAAEKDFCTRQCYHGHRNRVWLKLIIVWNCSLARWAAHAVQKWKHLLFCSERN